MKYRTYNASEIVEKKSSSGGINFCELLTVVFIVLKFCGVIHWSWLWVLSPTWIPTCIFIIVTLIFSLVKK